MSQLSFLTTLSAWTDRVTGVPDSLGYLGIVACMIAGYYSFTSNNHLFADVETAASRRHQEEEEEPDPPRNFTLKQLQQFDGSKEERSDTFKPVYLSVAGTVFDVSKGRDFYGPGGPYEAFAGHECGIALAKMSFDKEHLDNLADINKLNFGEKTELEGWVEKFQYYRNYPVLGKLIIDLPDAERAITPKELALHNGSGEVPPGYAAAPIYVAANGLVFDMSFGGGTFYGPDGPYQTFAGNNVTRALAKMSLDPADIENTSVEDCTEKQIQTMNDWVQTFQTRKLYPVVGKLVT